MFRIISLIKFCKYIIFYGTHPQNNNILPKEIEFFLVFLFQHFCSCRPVILEGSLPHASIPLGYGVAALNNPFATVRSETTGKGLAINLDEPLPPQIRFTKPLLNRIRVSSHQKCPKAETFSLLVAKLFFFGINIRRSQK